MLDKLKLCQMRPASWLQAKPRQEIHSLAGNSMHLRAIAAALGCALKAGDAGIVQLFAS